MKNRYRQQGFTLIELMIVVALIGILAAIAYPSYQRYVIKTKRTDMMTEMQNIASQIESRKLAQGRYLQVEVADFKGNFPRTGTSNAIYTITLSPTAVDSSDGKEKLTSGNWEIRATPIAAKQMANDGTLTLNAQGVKCRDKNNDGDTQDIGECGMGQEWNN